MDVDPGRALLAGAGLVAVAALLVVGLSLGGVSVGDPGADGGSLAEIDGDLPDGLARRGVTNGTAVGLAHRETLANRSFELEIRVERNIEDSNRQVRSVTTQTVVAGSDGRVRTDVVRTGATEFQRNAWTNGTVGLQREVVGNRTQYARIQPRRLQQRATGHLTVGELLSIGNFTTERVVERDGRTLLSLRAEEGAPDAATRLNAREVQSVSGDALVTARGQVRRVNLSIQYVDRQGRSVDVSITQRLSAVGSTEVRRPAWLDAALSETESSARVGPA